MLPNNWRYLRGDIYYADMEPHIGSEQGGKRPVVVLQNNIGNRHSPTLIVATVTTRTEKKKKQPTHVLVDSNPAFEEPSMILLEQIFTIDKSRIERFIGYATPGKCLVSQCNQTVPQRCCSRSDSLICSGLHFKKQPGFFFIVERG